MKKLITILCLIISIASFGQSVVTRTTGTTTPNDVRLMASQNLFIPRFTDTTNANTNLGIDSCGAIFFSYSDNGIYYRACSPKHWLLIGSGVIVNDTIYVKTPLYVFIDSLGHRVIAIQRSNGLYSGGVVTQDSCFNLDVSSANYSINFFSYTSANTILTVSAPDGSFPRIDLVYLDTTGQAKIRDGSATATPSPPSYNPVSEIALAYIYVPAGASCLGAITKTIYDGISDYPTQWGIALSGTFTTDTVNTDNPFHLNQAIFVSRYVDGSSITFTDAAADTITSTTVFKGHLYLNGALGSNNIQMQLFNTGTPVGNPITLLPYINPNDSNEYQLYQIRAGDFGVIAGNIFNQYKLTFSGNDLSGAKGLYLDYIQLQNGITNSNYNGHGVANFAMNATNDSVILTRDDGVTFTVPSGGGGSSITLKTNGTNNGSQSTLNLQQGTNVTLTDNGTGTVTINSSASGSANSNVGSGYRLAIPNTNNIKTLTGGYAMLLDSITTNQINLIVDSAALSLKYLRIVDTSAMLGHYFKDVTTPTDSTLQFVRGDNTTKSVTIIGGGTVLNGTGYVKMSGATPSYSSTIPMTDLSGVLPISKGGTNNGSLDVTNGNLFYSDGSKLVGLAHGTTAQGLRWTGSGYAWLDTTASSGGSFWSLTGNTGLTFPDTSRFLGTTNNTSLFFKTNNIYHAVLDSSGSFKVRIATVTKTDSSDITLVPHPTTPYILFHNTAPGSSFITNTGSGIFGFGTAIGGITGQLKAGSILASSTGTSSSFKVTSGVQSFVVGGSTDCFLEIQHAGLTDVGGFGSASGSADLTFRINGATSVSTGTQFMRTYGTSQHVSIGTSTSDVSNVLFNVNGQPNSTGTYQASVPAPKMTTGQRDSILTGISTISHTAGSGGTNGTYTNVAFTGGTGAGFHATLVVSSGAVISEVITDAGGFYTIGDVLTQSTIPGISGYTITVVTLTSTVIGAKIYNITDSTTDTYDGVGWAGFGRTKIKMQDGGTTGKVGQVALVSGTKALTINGVATTSRAFITLVSQAGTTTTTQSYIAVCTANTLTITAVTNAGSNTTNTLDTSTLNYFIVN